MRVVGRKKTSQKYTLVRSDNFQIVVVIIIHSCNETCVEAAEAFPSGFTNAFAIQEEAGSLLCWAGFTCSAKG